MKKKHSYGIRALVLLSFFIFVVTCSGGCGGSSTSAGSVSTSKVMRVFSIGNIEDVNTQDSLMLAFMAALNETLGTSDDISTITSKDALIVFSFNESDNDDIVNSLKKNAAVILFCPTRQIIQNLVNAVGYDDYKVPEVSKGEIFAIKQGNDEGNLFYMPSQPTVSLSTADPVTTSDDQSRDVSFVVDTREAVHPDALSEDEFQEEKFQDFMEWLNDSNDQTASVSDFNSASAIVRGTMDLNLSYTGSADNYGTPRHIWKAHYTAYALHSFADGSDYYIIELHSKNNPKTQFSHGTQTLKKKPANETREFDCLVDVANGYTRSLTFKHYFANDDQLDIEAISAAPSSNAGTDWFHHNFGTNVGYMRTHGGELTSYLAAEGSLQYDANLANNRTDTNVDREETTWTLSFNWPTDGADNIAAGAAARDYTKTYKALNVPNASSRIRDDYFAWVWKVPKSYWQSKGSPKFFQADVLSSHGRTEGFTYYSPNSKAYRVARSDIEWYKAGKTVNVPLPKAPHIAITQNLFELTRDSGTMTLSIASEEDWTATVVGDWITLNQSSGNATGGIPTMITFQYEPNRDGSDRFGTITFKSSQSGETVKANIRQNL